MSQSVADVPPLPPTFLRRVLSRCNLRDIAAYAPIHYFRFFHILNRVSISNKTWQHEAWKCLSKLDLHGDAAPAHAEAFVSSLSSKPHLEHLSDLCFSLRLPLESIRQLLNHCTPALRTLTVVLENATVDTIVPELFEDDVLGRVIEHVTRFEILGDISVQLPEELDTEPGADGTAPPAPKAAKATESSTPSSSLWKPASSSTPAPTPAAAAAPAPATDASSAAPTESQTSTEPAPASDSAPLTKTEAMEVDQAAEEIEEWVQVENLLRPLWAIVQHGLERLAPRMKHVKEIVLPQYFCPYSPILSNGGTNVEAHPERRKWMTDLSSEFSTVVFDCYPLANVFTKTITSIDSSLSSSGKHNPPSLTFNSSFFTSLELVPGNPRASINAWWVVPNISSLKPSHGAPFWLTRVELPPTCHLATLLHLACAMKRPYSEPELIKQLLSVGANPNAQYDGGVTPLHLAVDRGNVDAVRLLLLAGGDPTLRCSSKHHSHNSFTLAAHRGRLEVLQLLVESFEAAFASGQMAPHNVLVDAEGSNLIMLAVSQRYHAPPVDIPTNNFRQWRKRSAYAMRLSGGADSDDSGNGASVLQWLLNPKIMTLLQLDLNQHDASHLGTALHHARSVASVRMLIQLGFSVNVIDFERGTPLLWAAILGDVDVIQELLAHGAALPAPNSLSMKRMLCACATWPQCQFLLEKLLLTAADNDINPSKKRFTPPVVAAARSKNLEVVELLVEKYSANPHVKVFEKVWLLQSVLRQLLQTSPSPIRACRILACLLKKGAEPSCVAQGQLQQMVVFIASSLQREALADPIFMENFMTLIRSVKKIEDRDQLFDVAFAIASSPVELPEQLISFVVNDIAAPFTKVVRRKMRPHETVLMKAAANGHLNFVRAILSGGAESAGLQVRDRAGFTALMHAIVSLHPSRGEDIVRSLVDAGINLHAKSHSGQTAADILSQRTLTWRYHVNNSLNDLLKFLKAKQLAQPDPEEEERRLEEERQKAAEAALLNPPVVNGGKKKKKKKRSRAADAVEGADCNQQ